MATPLDLQEQEQLDALKAFWKQYGNLISWLLIAVLAAYAGLNGWRWWQRDQAMKAGAMFEQLERSALAGDANRAGQIASDLRERFAKTAYAEQGALLAARAQYEAGQSEAAMATLRWVADNATEDEYRAVARLRLAALLLQAKDYAAALQQLEGAKSPSFDALLADRRGDILLAQGKPEAARAQYLAAWTAMDPRLDYRGLVEAKLTALGVDPRAEGAAGAASAAAR